MPQPQVAPQTTSPQATTQIPRQVTPTKVDFNAPPDQDVINLAKAIRQHETGNRAIAGGSGEMASRYQYMPGTWASAAKQFLGDSNAPLTLENENKVTYARIKNWKDQGFNPAQIASLWNSGSPAHIDDNHRGYNSAGVYYDTPKYVQNVYSLYQKNKAENPPTPVQQPGLLQRAGSFIKQDVLGGGVKKPTGFLGSVFQSTLGSKGLAGVAQMPGKVIGQLGNLSDQQKLSEAIGNVSQQATAILKRAEATTDPAEKDRLRTVAQALFNQTQDLSQQRANLEQGNLTPRETISTSLNAALTAASGSGSATKGLVAQGLKNLPISALEKAPTLLPAAEKILTMGKGVVPRAIEQGLIGAGFTASGNIAEGRPVGENVGLGFGIGAAFPVAGTIAGKAAEAIAPAKNLVAKSLINSWVKPLQRMLSYGKDPAKGILDEGITGKSFEEVASKVNQARKRVGQELEDIVSTPEAESKIMDLTRIESKDKAGNITYKTVLDPIDQAIEDANRMPRTNAALVQRLQDAKDDILGKVTNPDGSFSYTRNLTAVTPKEAVQIKRMVGDVTKFTGNVSDDNIVNSALKRTYGAIKGEIEKAVPESKALNEHYANLTSADIALKYRDKIETRQNIIKFAPKLAGYGLAAGGVLTANPAMLLSSLAPHLIDKALSSATFKTNLAKFLYRATDAERKSFLLQVPVLKNIIEKIFGGKEKPTEFKVQQEIQKINPEDLAKIESLKPAYQQMYKLAETAKTEVDQKAHSIASQVGGIVAEAPIKGETRAIEKALQYHEGDLSQLTDYARNTIVVPDLEKLSLVYDRFKNDPNLVSIGYLNATENPLGYQQIIAKFKTSNGMVAEIQGNTPEIIYAKELEKDARKILGDQVYEKIKAAVGIEGGKGHKWYEAWRTEKSWQKRLGIELKSKAYFNQVRRAYEKSQIKPLEGILTKKSVLFASPNVKTGLNYSDAEKALKSEGHKEMLNQYRKVQKDNGLVGRMTGGIGVWADGAENTAYYVGNNIDPETLKYVGAKMGKIGQQKQVIHFTEGDGADELFHFDFGDAKPQKVSDIMAKHGIVCQTVGKHEAFVFNKSGEYFDKEMPQKLANALDELKLDKSHLSYYTGNGDFLGSFMEGEAARQDAIDNFYNPIIDKYEKRTTQGQGGTGAEAGIQGSAQGQVVLPGGDQLPAEKKPENLIKKLKISSIGQAKKKDITVYRGSSVHSSIPQAFKRGEPVFASESKTVANDFLQHNKDRFEQKGIKKKVVISSATLKNAKVAEFTSHDIEKLMKARFPGIEKRALWKKEVAPELENAPSQKLQKSTGTYPLAIRAITDNYPKEIATVIKEHGFDALKTYSGYSYSNYIVFPPQSQLKALSGKIKESAKYEIGKK